MFMGEYEHSIDAKGRVILPVKFRDELGPKFVVTRGLEGCLSVYTMEAWMRLAGSLKKLRASKENVRAFIPRSQQQFFVVLLFWQLFQPLP